MRTTDFLYDGPELQLRCVACLYRFRDVKFIGPSATLGDFMKELARAEREAHSAIGDQLCPGPPTQEAA